ncbi:MAG: HTTM domain-containing protein [Planctomycetaceae bacterium]
MAVSEVRPPGADRIPQTAPLRPAWLGRLFKPVDIGLLAFFRIAFGVILLWEVTRFFRYGWIAAKFVEPEMHFTYFGFSWVRPWAGTEAHPALGMQIHFAVLGVLALCIAVGFYYRIVMPLFLVGFAYVFLLEQSEYLNHFYFVILLSGILCVLPAHRVWSVDAWRQERNPVSSETPGFWEALEARNPVFQKIPGFSAPAWTLWLLRAQIAVVYFFGGVAKLNSDWIHGEPMRMFLATRTDFPLLGPYMTEEWMVQVFVWGGLLLDLLIVPFLLWKPTRGWAFVAILSFHVLNNMLFQIGIFPWLMMAATLLFFPPEWVSARPAARGDAPRKRGALRRKRHKAGSGETASRSPVFGTTGFLVAAALGFYLLVQVVLPLRHFVYPGNVSWTEEGHRFAWHMKLRVKQAAHVEFHATDAEGNRFDWTLRPRGHDPPAVLFTAADAGGRPLTVDDPLPELTSRQFAAMSCKPDMTLQFCHALADALRARGRRDVAVRVVSYVSLNSREPQLLIDPNINLAAEERTLGHAEWIVPLTEKIGDR